MPSLYSVLFTQRFRTLFLRMAQDPPARRHQTPSLDSALFTHRFRMLSCGWAKTQARRYWMCSCSRPCLPC